MQIFKLDLVLGVLSQNKMYFNHNGKTLTPIRTYDKNLLLTKKRKKINIRIESEEIYTESGNFALYNNLSYKNFENYKKLKIGHEVLDKLSAFEVGSEFEWKIAQNISKNIKKYNKTI